MSQDSADATSATVAAALNAAEAARRDGDSQRVWRYLGEAHVIAQAHPSQHLRVHCRMFITGLRQGNIGQCLNQTVLIVAALLENLVNRA